MDFDFEPIQINDLDNILQNNKLKSAEIRKVNQVESEWFLVVHSSDGVSYVLGDKIGPITYDNLSDLDEVIANLPLYSQ